MASGTYPTRIDPGAAYPGNCAVLCTQNLPNSSSVKTRVLGKTFFIANSSKYADKDI